MWPTHTDPTALSELNTAPTSFAFVALLFAFCLLLVSALVISPHHFYLFLSSFSLFFSPRTVVERIAGIHSNMFCSVCVRARVCV